MQAFRHSQVVGNKGEKSTKNGGNAPRWWFSTKQRGRKGNRLT
jgi:hypothetical protein